MSLPCRHQEKVITQVQPTIELLSDLNVLHPDILREHSIEPEDYKGGLVFRSAIESIRGKFIASSTTGHEGLVKDVLENMLNRSQIYDFTHHNFRQRYDFTIQIKEDPDYYAALEVKGGEGNSINISDRPIWAKEFGVWCHLDGAIVNQPSHGAHSIINRIANEMVRKEKRVDVLFFKDVLCGTRACPCPKYPGKEETIGLNAAPDIFLFPKRVPSLKDPNPPVYKISDLELPNLILELFSVKKRAIPIHVWEVHIKIVELQDGRLQRIVSVIHKSAVSDESKSRPWRPGI